jgi:hypothetical protein
MTFNSQPSLSCHAKADPLPVYAAADNPAKAERAIRSVLAA